MSDRVKVSSLKPGDYIDASLLKDRYPEGINPDPVGIVNHVTPSEDTPGKLFLRSSPFTGDVDPDDEVELV